jgi:acetylglutamate kinase
MLTEAVKKSATLIEALPYIKAFNNKIVVIKLGGSAQTDHAILRRIFTDIDCMITLGMRPVVVYGGGKKISAAMEKAGKKAEFIDGQRVTDRETIQIVANVLIDDIGTELLGLLEECGGRGELVNGRDHDFLRAVKKNLPDKPEVDLGCVGEPVAIDAVLVYNILEKKRIPIIGPVARGCGLDNGTLYNINADTASSLIARDLHAEKLVFLSDITGIYRDVKDQESLISHINQKEVYKLIDEGVISGGMIPKVQAAEYALEGGVRKVHIVSGEQPHALILELFTDTGVGTELVL